jgi:MFS family permease
MAATISLQTTESRTTSPAAPDLARFEEESARYYRRNFAAGLIHGVFFQMSTAFGSIHTVLPAFVTLLTTSTMAVGLMAAIQEIGEIVPQLFTAYLLEDKPRKKGYLLGVITLRWLSWGLLAWLTYQYGLTRPGLVLIVLIALFGLFSVAGGMGAVLYADIFARAIPANRRGRFTGARQILGFALAILAGWIVKLILDNGIAFPFPTNYSLIFGLSAASLAVAFIGFALIREPVYPVQRRSKSLGAMLRQSIALVKINPNFRRFLASRAILGLAIGLAPFYIVHARQTLDISAGAVGLFLSFQMAGAALSNILWAFLADKYGNKYVIIGTIASAGLAPILALTLPDLAPQAYGLVFALLGAMLSGMRIGYNNFVLEMASPEMRATCVALQNTMLAPVTLMPLVAGFLIQELSFGLVFGVEAMLMAVGLLLSIQLLDPRHGSTGACVS